MVNAIVSSAGGERRMLWFRRGTRLCQDDHAHMAFVRRIVPR